jgi:ribosomal-protein-alanine N-acetyltransferase
VIERYLSFRRMRAEDLDVVMENEVRSYAFPWTRGIFVDCLKQRYECWVVERDQAVIGHGILSVTGTGEAHLLNVCIAREHQGEGFGRRLVEHMLGRARTRQADAVFLEVRPSNRVAVAIYESLGFNEVGRRKNYYPTHTGHEDARILALQLVYDE